MGWFRGAVENLGYRLDEMESLVREHIADTRDALTVLDDATDVIRYGLMEHGGFVRNETLSHSQRSHMFTQERANFVMWNIQRNRAENTDVDKGGEEETPTEDPVISGPTDGMDNLLESMRRDQNAALALEAWEDASMIQRALITVMDASAGANPIGMTMEVVETIRGIFQRLYRLARNRGHSDRANAYYMYVNDLHTVMQG